MLDQVSDPDYYYHVALSKQIAASGFPETVPQVKGIGWDILFTDKEYLYHVLTSFFYSWFGEGGLRLASVLTFSICTLALAYQSLKTLGLRLFLLPLFVLALDPYFIRRMIMVRPQTLAVLLFVFILIGFITQRKYLILFSSLFFALSYHGLQIPGLLIAASLFTSLVAKPAHIRLAGFCVVGLVAGGLLNPYFPGNLELLAQITNILRDTSENLTGVAYGNEIYPWRTSEFLDFSLMSFTVLALAFVSLGHLSTSSRENHREDYSQMLFLTVALCLFFAVAMITPRGREYLIPCSVLLAIQVLRHTPVTGTVLLTLMAVAQVITISPQYEVIFQSEKAMEPRLAMLEGLKKLPADEKAHVLNCNWSQSPYLMYTRPNMSFVDILDPSYLMIANKALHEARADFNHGRVSDLRFIASDVFKAQYVFCDINAINTNLDADPHFQRIFPEIPVAKSSSTFAIFKVQHSAPLDNFVRSFLYSLPESREQWLPLDADAPGAEHPVPTTYLNVLAKVPKDSLAQTSADNKERVANCIYIKPKDLSHHVGANHIGIGGGPNVRLWVNGDPLYESEGEQEQLRSMDLLIPLAKPLKASDTVTAMICPGVKQTYLGITLSFWTSEQMQNICAEKSLQPSTETDTTQWAFKGIQEKNCLAPIAARPKIALLEAEKPNKKRP